MFLIPFFKYTLYKDNIDKVHQCINQWLAIAIGFDRTVGINRNVVISMVVETTDRYGLLPLYFSLGIIRDSVSNVFVSKRISQLL